MVFFLLGSSPGAAWPSPALLSGGWKAGVWLKNTALTLCSSQP